MRRPLVFVGLAMLTGVVLAATVFRNDVAKATGLAGSAPVTVMNTATNAVPVKEQNLDSGNIKVHEEGTADVHVTNSTLTVAPPDAVTCCGFGTFPAIAASVGGTTDSLGFTATASALSIHLDAGVDSVVLGSGPAAVFLGPDVGGNSTIVLALTRPLSFDEIKC